MLLVRISVEDHRIIDRARTESELQGVRQLVLDRIQLAQTLKELGKVPTVKVQKFAWSEAFEACKSVLGSALTKPPFPDETWFRRINTVIRQNGLNEESCKSLAEYAKANLMGGKRTTISFDFLICQHVRILAGEFSNVGAGSAAPNLTLHQLPEE